MSPRGCRQSAYCIFFPPSESASRTATLQKLICVIGSSCCCPYEYETTSTVLVQRIKQYSTSTSMSTSPSVETGKWKQSKRTVCIRQHTRPIFCEARPIGAPKFTYGRTVKKALAAFGIKLKNTEWQPLVVDRAAWKAATGSDKFLGRCGSSRNHPRRPPQHT